MENASPLAIETRSLVSGYGDRPVLRGVDLHLEHASLLGVVGPNGSGKSTLIRSLTGRLPIREGWIKINQNPIDSYSSRTLATQVAVVPQAAPMLFAFTVNEIVAMGRFPHRGALQSLTHHDRELIDHSLHATDTYSLRHRHGNELSGGELQRVMIARALAQDTSILLLDEPTAHLDLGHQLETFDLLRKLAHNHQKTILCISHDLNLSSEFFEKLILFSEGKIHSQGAPSSVITEENLHSVYGASVVIRSNPYSGRPLIVVNRCNLPLNDLSL